MNFINNIRNIIASLANIPMTLESGLSWDRSLTEFLMKNSPFFIRPFDTDRIELVNSNGEWVLHTSSITEALLSPNGYVYFITASKHKYGFVPYCDNENKSTKHIFPLTKPEYRIPNMYKGFGELSHEDKGYYYDIEDYLVQQQALKDGKYFGKLKAKRDDFGFVDDMFVHISDTNCKVDSLAMYNNYYIIGNIADGKKGKKLVNYTFDYPTINYYRDKAMMAFINERNEAIIRFAKHQYETAMDSYNSQKHIWDAFGFCATKVETEVDSGAYKDYKHKTIYTFSCNISKEEFISFLKEMKQEIKDRGNWWEEYSIIKGSGNTWTYTWVRPSTH